MFILVLRSALSAVERLVACIQLVSVYSIDSTCLIQLDTHRRTIQQVRFCAGCAVPSGRRRAYSCSASHCKMCLGECTSTRKGMARNVMEVKFRCMQKPVITIRATKAAEVREHYVHSFAQCPAVSDLGC